MGFLSRAIIKIFSAMYRLVPDGLKALVPRDLRTRVKIWIRFEKYQSDEIKSMQLRIEQALFFQKSGQLHESLELWNQLENDSRKHAAFHSQIQYNKKLVHLLMNFEPYSETLNRYLESKRSPKKIALFTAVSGGYDSIRLPLHIDQTFDYFVFTDGPVKLSKLWQARPMTYLDADPSRSARWVKTHPHVLFENYDFAIWLDGNMVAIDNLSELLQAFVDSGQAIGAIPHPYRDNIYQEFEACSGQNKDNSSVMKNQIDGYRRLNFEHDDLAETGFLLFNLKHPSLETILERWWAEIDKGSRRDQLSFNFAAGKQGYFPLLQKGESARTHQALALLSHGVGSQCLLSEKMPLQEVDPYSESSFLDNKSDSLKMGRDHEIDVVICVHNALDEVKKCLFSIDRYQVSANYNVIVIDDGSDQPTADYLKEFAQAHSYCRLARSEQARGYTKAANHGLSLSQAEMVILLNSDTVVTENWAEKMASVLFSSPKMAVVGPMSNAASHQSIPDHTSKKKQTAINDLPEGMTPEDLNVFCEKKSTTLMPLVPLVHGFCFAVRRQVVEQLEGFDHKNFPQGYGEENDFCFRVTNHGYTMAIATHTYIYHVKSKSYQTKKRQELMKMGSKKLVELHGRNRVIRSVQSMESNPILKNLRKQSLQIY